MLTLVLHNIFIFDAVNTYGDIERLRTPYLDTWIRDVNCIARMNLKFTLLCSQIAYSLNTNFKLRGIRISVNLTKAFDRTSNYIDENVEILYNPFSVNYLFGKK